MATWPRCVRDRPRLLAGAAVVLAVLVVFGRALQGAFVWDDEVLLARNPFLRIDHLPRVLFDPLWAGAPGSAGGAFYWRPLTSLLFALGDGVPIVLHAMSLLLHAGAALLALRLAELLTGSVRLGLLAGLLFALHPVQVESVAWITALNDPLAGLLSLAMLLAWERWRRAEVGLPWGALLWFGLALLAKETALLAPAFALLLDLAAGRLRRRPAAAWVPLLAVAALWAFLHALAMLKGAYGPQAEHGLTLGRIVALRLELAGLYLRQLVLPSVPMPFPTAPERTDAGALAIALLLVAPAVALAWFAWRRRLRAGVAGLGIVFVAMLPGLALVDRLGPWAYADRYQYLGVFGAACATIALLDRWSLDAATVVGGGLVVLSAAVSFHAAGRWRSPETLFSAAVANAPGAVTPRYLLGRTLLRDYAVTGERALLPRARSALLDARDLLAQRDEQRLVLSRTRAVDIEVALALVALHEATSARARQTVQAKLARLETDHPDEPRVKAALGVALAMEERYEEAAGVLNTALRLDPNDVDTMCNLGRVLAHLPGRIAGAIRNLERALRVAPDHPGCKAVLASVLARRAVQRGRAGEVQRGLADFDRAITLAPAPGPYLLQRGKLAVAARRFDDAAASLSAATRAMPNSFDAQYALGALLLQLGKKQEALPPLERALELHPRTQTAKVPYRTLAETIERLRRN